MNIVLISGFSLGLRSWFAFTCSTALYKEHRTHFFRNQYKFYFFSYCRVAGAGDGAFRLFLSPRISLSGRLDAPSYINYTWFESTMRFLLVMDIEMVHK